MLGGTNNSLLAHLLGPTPVNSLPPHCHCSICRYLIFNAHADDGWDLPDLACPKCGAPMVADGHNLRSRSLIGESVVFLQVPKERFAPICAWLRDYWAQRDCQTDTEAYSDAEVMGLRLTLPEGTISPVVSTKNTATGSFAFPRLSDISRMLQNAAPCFCTSGSFQLTYTFVQTAWLDSLQTVCICFKACAVRRINSSPGAFLSVFETSTISW